MASFFLIIRLTNPPTVIFRKVEKKKNYNFFYLFYPPTLHIICFVEKIIHFLASFCVFLKVTLLKMIVWSRFLKNDEISTDLIHTVGANLTSFTVFVLEIL